MGDEEKVLRHWEDKWEIACQGKEEFIFFQKCYSEIFKNVLKSKEKFKKMSQGRKDRYINIQWFFFIFAICMLFISGIILLKSKNWDWGQLLDKETFLLFMVEVLFVLLIDIWASSIYSKHLDIIKPQETWARHSAALYGMNREMIRYLNCLDGYSTHDREKYFIKNILKVLQESQDKFSFNMETKETNLMDMFKYTKQQLKNVKMP